MLTSTQKIVSDDFIKVAMGGAFFGGRSGRHILNEAVLKCALGYASGSMVRAMMIELGLVTKGTQFTNSPTLSSKGREYLRAAYGIRFEEMSKLSVDHPYSEPGDLTWDA